MGVQRSPYDTRSRAVGGNIASEELEGATAITPKMPSQIDPLRSVDKTLENWKEISENEQSVKPKRGSQSHDAFFVPLDKGVLLSETPISEFRDMGDRRSTREVETLKHDETQKIGPWGEWCDSLQKGTIEMDRASLTSCRSYGSACSNVSARSNVTASRNVREHQKRLENREKAVSTKVEKLKLQRAQKEAREEADRAREEADRAREEADRAREEADRREKEEVTRLKEREAFVEELARAEAELSAIALDKKLLPELKAELEEAYDFEERQALAKGEAPQWYRSSQEIEKEMQNIGARFEEFEPKTKKLWSHSPQKVHGESPYGENKTRQAKPLSYAPKVVPLDWEVPTLNLEDLGSKFVTALPVSEPPVFSGSDQEGYLPFKTAFQEVVVARCGNYQQRYSYLMKYTSGRALQIVQSCYNPLNYEDAFRRATKLLEEIFGSGYKLAQDYIAKLRNWPVLRSDKMKTALQELYLFLLRVQNIKRASGQEFAQMDNHSEIRVIIDKLPPYMAVLWRDLAASALKSGRIVKFDDLVEFVKNQSDKENLPIFGEIKRKRETQPVGTRVAAVREKAERFGGSYEQDKNRIPTDKVFVRQPNKLENLQSTQEQETQTKQEKVRQESEPSNGVNRGKFCYFCEGKSHTADVCFALSRDENREKIFGFMKHEGLCFRCLQKDHIARDCGRKIKCPECGSPRHCRSLHQYYNSSEPKDTKNRNQRVLSSRVSAKVFSPVVPALVRQKGQDAWVETNVALDNWASSSFMSLQFAEELRAKGKSSEISLSTLSGVDQKMELTKIENLEIRRVDKAGPERYDLLPVHVIESWPFNKDDVPDEAAISSCEGFKELPWRCSNAGIGLLLGCNEPELLRCIRSVGGGNGGPYASEHALGWALNGPLFYDSRDLQRCCRVKIDDPSKGLENMYGQEFLDEYPDCLSPSVEDKRWQDKVMSSLQMRPDGKCEIGLPFKEDDPVMPNNKYPALGQLKGLKSKMIKDCKYKYEYISFMEKMIKNGHLEKVPLDEPEPPIGKVWYVQHHGVYHKVKGKLRVVFDCSRKCSGISLNDKLLTGPDLLNKLVGVLLLFRRGKVPIMGDIEQMFLQIKVPSHHSDFMRVWWWPEGDLEQPPRQYRLTSHTFGAVSSPSIANWVVSYVAVMMGEIPSDLTKEVLEKCAYMDDILGSFDSEVQAIEVWTQVRHRLEIVGFNLTSLSSPVKEVLNRFDRKLWNETCDLDLEASREPKDRVLGLTWSLLDDTLSVKTCKVEKALTKRGMLSVIGGVYDPLGLVVPVVVPARSLFQQLCFKSKSWDEDMEELDEAKWKKWLGEMEILAGFSVPRWLGNTGTESTAELHLFCDGSQIAYAAVAYARIIKAGTVEKVTLLMAKARQNPISRQALCTIPRIELAAAKLSVELSVKINREMPKYFSSVKFWSDSTVVLGYIRSDVQRFQRFVENRVSYIVANTDRKSWAYVPGKFNVADIASRGCTADALICHPAWREGPQFLKTEPIPNFEEPAVPELPEIRVACTAVVSENVSYFDKILESSGTWSRILFRVAVFIALVWWIKKGDIPTLPFSPELYKEAEACIWRRLQSKNFPGAREALVQRQPCRFEDWKKYCPFLDNYGVARVGGRIGLSNEVFDIKHPVLLSARSVTVQALIRHIHEQAGHFGSNYLLALVREKYQVIGLSTYVRKLSRTCVLCRKLNGRLEQPQMASLPKCRVEPARKAFDIVGIDYFGPFEIVNKRSRVKVWGVVFTCLTSRAVHLELAEAMDTGSFLNCFRRFVARRGRCSVVYSDNGTNLVGACREMKKQLDDWNKLNWNSDNVAKGIEWHFNPPHGSNFGGIWEREIRTVRKVLLAVMKAHGSRANFEVLRTAFCEVEALLNARPISPVTADVMGMGPLTPNHVLLTRPHQGVDAEVVVGTAYLNKRWRFAQHLVDLFWARWRKEYLVYLRERSKWTNSTKNLQVGDLVISEEPNVVRGKWPLGLVEEVMLSTDGVVRKVKLRVVGGETGVREKIRPVNKLVVVLKGINSGE